MIDLYFAGGTTGIDIGINGSSTIFKVVGSAGTITVDNGEKGIEVGSDGTLEIEPTANGSAGLSSIDLSTGTVTLDATRTFTHNLDSSMPSVGDKWDVIVTNESITGTFGTLDAPVGYTLIQTNQSFRPGGPRAVGQKVVIEVTVIPSIPEVWVDFSFGDSGDGL